MTSTKKFEAGKTYYFVATLCAVKITVTKRTAKTITVKSDDDIFIRNTRYKINESKRGEFIKLGFYADAPWIYAVNEYTPDIQAIDEQNIENHRAWVAEQRRIADEKFEAFKTEAERDEIMSTPLVTVEAMDVATEAEETQAAADHIREQYEYLKDWVNRYAKASGISEQEAEKFCATFFAGEFNMKPVNEVFDKPEETVELPVGEITVSSGAEAWAIVGKYFPNGLNFCGSSKGFNCEDTFSFTADNTIFVKATCTPDNSRVECLEVINTNESGSKRHVLNVYIKHDETEEISDGELLKAHKEYFNHLGGGWKPVYCDYNKTPETDGSEDDNDADEISNLLPDVSSLNDVEAENTVESKPEVTISAAPTADEFSIKLAELEAAKADAQAKEDAAKAVYKAAEDETEKRRIELQNFLDEHASRLCDKLQSLKTTQRMTLITARGTKEFCRDFKDIYIDSFNYFDVEFVFRNWRGISLARYDTPAQVETVITMLKNTIARGEKEFTFPTVDELNQSSKKATADSLARAMKSATERKEVA